MCTVYYGPKWCKTLQNSYIYHVIFSWPFLHVPKAPHRRSLVFGYGCFLGGAKGAPKLSHISQLQHVSAPHSKSASTPEVLGGPCKCRGKFKWHTMQSRSFGRAHGP